MNLDWKQENMKVMPDSPLRTGVVLAPGVARSDTWVAAECWHLLRSGSPIGPRVQPLACFVVMSPRDVALAETIRLFVSTEFTEAPEVFAAGVRAPQQPLVDIAMLGPRAMLTGRSPRQRLELWNVVLGDDPEVNREMAERAWAPAYQPRVDTLLEIGANLMRCHVRP